MDWGENNDGGDHLELSLSLQLKSTSQKSSILFPFTFPSKQPLHSLSGIASGLSSASGINVNIPDLPVGVDIELPPPRQPIASSPDITISSASRRRSEREEPEGGGHDDPLTRKKLRLSKEQVTVLEDTFKHQDTLNSNEKESMARQLNLNARQVEVWFQNRRARIKTKKLESDCELWKKQHAIVVEKKHRLQKENAELRAQLNASLHAYLQMKPATTISSKPPDANKDGDWVINQLK